MNPLILVLITATLFMKQTSCDDMIDVSLAKIEETTTKARNDQNEIREWIKKQDAITKQLEDITRNIEAKIRQTESLIGKATLITQDAKNLTAKDKEIITVADNAKNQLITLSMPKPPITVYPVIPAPSDDKLEQ